MADLDYFNDVYLKRLNRYGLDYQTRTQNRRKENFEKLLFKSVYRVDLKYNGELQPALLEPFRQNETKSMQRLLTRVELNFPNGAIIEVENKDLTKTYWMIWWLEDITGSGYNSYVVVKMTHYVTWKTPSGLEQSSYAYMYGQEDNMLMEEIRSRSRMDSLYTENLKSSFLVMPANKDMEKDSYLEIVQGDMKDGFRVTGYDRISTIGVEYVTVDPTYIYDNSPNPIPSEGDNAGDFFWMGGGK